MNELKAACLNTWKSIKDADLMRTTNDHFAAFRELVIIKERLSEGALFNCQACEVAARKLELFKEPAYVERCIFCPVNWSPYLEWTQTCIHPKSAYSKLKKENITPEQWDALIDEMIECIELSKDEDWCIYSTR